MIVDTQNYQDTHGRKPSRRSGAWTFLIERRPGECVKVFYSGNYSQAIQECKAEAKLIGGASRIIVCP